MSDAPEPTALYRVWGVAGLLLYIGISNNFGRRWKEHAKKQPWWGEKRRLTVDEWFDSREDAEAAETTAIKAERPKYNKRHASGSPEAAEKTKPLPRLTEQEVLDLPACVDLLTAGRAFGFGRSQSFRLAREGNFPCRVIRIGERFRVPQAGILAALNIERSADGHETAEVVAA